MARPPRARIRFIAVVIACAASALTASAVWGQGPDRHATLPFVSPDGKHIVYVRDLPDKSAELVVIDADGNNPRTLAHDPAGSLMGDWTAGGREVTYVMTANDTTTLFRLGLAGGTPVPVARVSCRGLRLSNDGKRLAYSVGEWTRSRLTVATLDGLNGAPSGGGSAITDSSASYFNIAWSRDDQRIAVTRLDPSHALSVWVMDRDGAHARAVTAFPDSMGRAQWPTWAPDGKRIAVQVGRYDRNDHSRDRSDIWVVDVTSGKSTNLTPSDDAWMDETPSWSRDGKTIVFQSTRSGRFEVWRMNADGGSPTQLTH